MKKSILFVAVMLITSTFMTAQESVYFGAKGGLNFANFSGDGFSGFDDGKTRTAYHIGLLAEIPLSERISLQPEVLYSAQGFDIKRIDDSQDVEYQLDYITVPVMAKFYVVNGLALEVGPQFGFVVQNEIEGPSATVKLGEDNINNFDFSLGLGASYKFNKFFVYGRYNAGLTDIYEYNGADAKNSVIHAGVGFMF